MSNRRPNKYDSDSKHAYYGIFFWFSTYTEIKDNSVQKGLVDWFLQDWGFVAPTNCGKKGIKAAKATFISNRWESFKKYVLLNKDFYIEQLYT